MTRVLLSEGFKQDVLIVESDRVLAGIFRALDLLEIMPTAGSRDVPASASALFGQGVRKLVVSPFDIIYRYDEDADEVRVAGLIHQRAAW